MSASSIAAVLGTLIVVLGIMGVALRLLRRYAGGVPGHGGRVRMEVIQRLALGQKQGIAIVRIGSRVLAVGMGDGGVRPIAELGEGDLTASAQSELGAAPGRAVGAALSRWLPVGLAAAARAARRTGAAEPQIPSRISYVAPIEDFQAVLSMALGGKHATGGARA